MVHDPFLSALGDDWSSDDDAEVCHVEPASGALYGSDHKCAEEKVAPQRHGLRRRGKDQRPRKPKVKSAHGDTEREICRLTITHLWKILRREV